MPDRYGGMWWSASLGAVVSTSRLQRSVDGPSIRQALHQEPEERCQRCRGYLRSGGSSNMRFVTVRSVEQQDMQALHLLRSERVRQRTATANQIRGLLSEYGVAIGKGINQLRRALPGIIEKPDNGLSPALRSLIEDARQDLVRLDSRIEALSSQIERVAREDEAARRLQTIPGIGTVIATALLAGLGDARQFRRGREVSAFLGIVPRQHSSGGKDRLPGISKRGDRYSAFRE